MFTQPRKRGQAIVLIVFAIIGLIAIVALAIDGGNVFLNRRRAQNAADTAVVAGALKIAGGGNSSAELSAAKAAALSAATAIATSNGYTDGSGVTTVTVYTMDSSSATDPTKAGCSSTALSDPRDLAHPTVPPDLISNYIVVTIKSATKTYFAPIVGINKLSYCVFAISHAVRGTTGIPFYGNSIVALDPTPGDYGFNSGTAAVARWVVNRGGIFSNSNAYSKDASSVTFQNGACVTTVGTTSSSFAGSCAVAQDQTALKYNYPADIIPLLPPIPPCTGTATFSGGMVREQVGKEGMGSILTGQDLLTGNHTAYAPGVYCITDTGGNANNTITGTGVTFYIQSSVYLLKFVGGGTIGASAPTTGTYKGMLMFSGITPTPCTQNIDIRGNGSTPIVGSIFLPSACIDYRGNGVGDLTDSMMVGYRISSNGGGELYVSYNADHNYHPVISPTVELTK